MWNDLIEGSTVIENLDFTMADVEDDDGENSSVSLPASYQVTSEVTAFTKGEKLNDSAAVLSRFDFAYPPSKNEAELPKKTGLEVDKDGDITVTRKNNIQKEDVVLIEHQHSSTLDLVGEQLWCGALYLADFILHHPEIFNNAYILELASGVGLTSIVASMFAKQVIISDVNRGDILKLIERNVDRNKTLMKADVQIHEIDFLDHSTLGKIQDKLNNVTILLAADVVYYNPLTDGFLETVLELMSEPPNKILFMAMERRYVFTTEDMDTVAPCYEYLLTRLEWLRCQNLSKVDWTIELLESPCEQYFTYERNKNLVIFRIEAKLK